MTAKKPAGKPNPFKAGTGHRPPLLAGRDAETRLLAEALDLLSDKREKMWGPLVSYPFPPIKVTGPRGVGKTTLLGWAERQAKKRRIRCVSCSGLKSNEEGHTMHELLANVSIVPRLFQRSKGDKVDVPGKVGAGLELDQSRSAFESVAGLALWFKPLLLLDEVQHYELPLLREVLQGSQQLIRQGYPLGVVLAGTPRLDSHLAKAESTFITRCRKIRINTLDDAATREALRAPFEQEGVKLAPDALEAMAAQTDSYPYFIQLVGQKVWEAMEKAGRRDVDVEMVRLIEEQARIGRQEIYSEAYREMKDNKVLPYARQIMELLEREGGKVHEDVVTSALVAANDEVDEDRAEEIYAHLREDGFIWTVNDETSPGIPSFFNYFKDRQ